MRRTLVCVFTFILSILITFPASAQTVLKRMRLGNMAESMSYISNGPDAGTIAIEDGMQLVGFPNDGQGQLKTLFDFSKLGFTSQPTGFGYMSDEQLFVFTHPPTNSPTTELTLSDRNGNPAGSVIFTWPPDFADGNPYPEGIVWIPKTEPRYGGDFIFAGFQNATGVMSHFFVVDRSGNLVAEITPNVDPNNVFFYVTGLGYRNGHLIAGLTDQTLWELDLDGNVTAGPFTYGDLYDIEGVAAVTGADRIAITSNASGKLVFLDPNYIRLQDERSYKVGFGIGNVFDVAWDPATQEYLVDSQAFDPPLGLPEIAAINSDWTSARQVLDLTTANASGTRIDYLADMNAFAIYHRSPPLPRAFYYYDSNGNKVGQDNMPTTYVPGGFAYIPTTQQYAIRKNTDAHTIYIYDRANLLGQPTRTIDLSSLGVTTITNLCFSHPEDPSGGQFLVVADGKLLMLDFAGHLIARFNNPPHINSARVITSGPYAGNYAGMYTANDELFIFALPQRQALRPR